MGIGSLSKYLTTILRVASAQRAQRPTPNARSKSASPFNPRGSAPRTMLVSAELHVNATTLLRS